MQQNAMSELGREPPSSMSALKLPAVILTKQRQDHRNNHQPDAGLVDPRITRSTGHSSIDDRVVDIGGIMRSALRKGKTSSWAIIDTSTPSVRPARIARKALGVTRATELR